VRREKDPIMATVPPAGILPFLAWADNFDEQLTAAGPTFGVLAADALAFHNLRIDLVAKQDLLDNPTTKTPVARANRDVSFKATTAKARQLLKIISAFPALTPGQREELQMNPKDPVRTHRPPPATRPVLQLGRDGTFRVRDELTPDRRAKPADAQGCQIVMKIDGPAPLTPADAHPGVLATRTDGQLPIPPGSDGKTLYAIASWYSETGETGPASDVVSVVIAA
jgi:hypothetical protein